MICKLIDWPSASPPRAWLTHAQRSYSDPRDQRLCLPVYEYECERVRCQAHRILQWAEAGLPAPQLIAVGEDHYVTADAGPSLLQRLAEEPCACARASLLAAAANALGRVHHAGYCHGSPTLRHMTFDGKRFSFFHLQRPPRWFSLSKAQARDFLVFVLSAAAAIEPPQARAELHQLWSAYVAAGPPPSTVGAIQHSVGLMRAPLRMLRFVPRRRVCPQKHRALEVLALAA